MNIYIALLVGGLLAIIEAQNINDPVGNEDPRHSTPKISRTTGTGLIPVGFAFIVLLALALFILLIWIILFFKRDKDIRGSEKTLFITTC